MNLIKSFFVNTAVLIFFRIVWIIYIFAVVYIGHKSRLNPFVQDSTYVFSSTKTDQEAARPRGQMGQHRPWRVPGDLFQVQSDVSNAVKYGLKLTFQILLNLKIFCYNFTNYNKKKIQFQDISKQKIPF